MAVCVRAICRAVLMAIGPIIKLIEAIRDAVSKK